jgi:hypothetical protein
MAGMSESATAPGRTGGDVERIEPNCRTGALGRAQSTVRHPRYWARAKTENPLARFVPSLHWSASTTRSLVGATICVSGV